YYHLTDGKVVGLWKHALTSVSNDNGKSWQYTPLRAPGFVNSNAKIWGQRTGDGKYATVYNPSEFRWPLAVSTSIDGLNYTDLLLIKGGFSRLRYGCKYSSFGRLYVSGIKGDKGAHANKTMWSTYSMNKQAMWVAQINVPVESEVKEDVVDDFSKNARESFNTWNI